MTIRFNLDFEDLLSFQQNVITHAHTHQIKKAYFKWITAIILFFLALYLMNPSLITTVISLIIVTMYIMFFPFLYDKIAYSKLTKQMEKNDYSHVLGTCEVTISDKGIERQLNDKTMYFEWNRFEKSHEDDEHYFLYVSDLEGIIISKKPEQMNEEEQATYNAFFNSKIHKYVLEEI